jgi:hypothetical protein
VYLHAVFHRLSQPVEPVRWSTVALITDDQYAEAESHLPAYEVHKKYKYSSFLILFFTIQNFKHVFINDHSSVIRVQESIHFLDDHHIMNVIWKF